MARTVSDAFSQFFDAINLKGDYREASNQRKEHLISLLKKEFDIIDAFGIGSIPKYTALKNCADLDIMVALHQKHIEGRNPIQVLQTIRDALAAHKTNVRKNGQAVTLYYTSWPH